MKMPTGAISDSMLAPCGMNCSVCYKHCYHKNPCTGCLQGDQRKTEHRRKFMIKVCAKENREEKVNEKKNKLLWSYMFRLRQSDEEFE